MLKLRIKEFFVSAKIVLATSSKYRKELMKRLAVSFISASPGIDEKRKPKESAYSLARRLSEEKSQSQAYVYTDHLIIGSDQVAILNPLKLDPSNLNAPSFISKPCMQEDAVFITKPDGREEAFNQLKAQSGQRVTFLTGVAVLDTRRNSVETDVVITEVLFRKLNEKEINNYLTKDTPYDCTGSLRIESCGISLLDAVYSSDPTALIGLPLIQLRKMLRI